MEEKVNFALVGVFVLVLGAALMGGVLWFSSGKSYSATYDIYQTYMKESVSGLSLNSSVRYRGVEVGKVKNIALAPGNVEQVQLTLAIERGTPVKVDTLAVLQSHGITGIAFVELTGGSQGSAPLEKQGDEEYPVIPTEPSLMKRLDTSISTMLINLNRTSESFNALMDEGNRRAVKKTLADLATVAHTLAARSDTIDASLGNAARIMENTASMSDDLPKLVQRVQRSADSFDRMTGQLAHAGESAGNTLEGTRQFTRETLPELHQLVLEMRELTTSLRRVSVQLEQNPSALIYGKPAEKRGPGE